MLEVVLQPRSIQPRSILSYFVVNMSRSATTCVCARSGSSNTFLLEPSSCPCRTLSLGTVSGRALSQGIAVLKSLFTDVASCNRTTHWQYLLRLDARWCCSQALAGLFCSRASWSFHTVGAIQARSIAPGIEALRAVSRTCRCSALRVNRQASHSFLSRRRRLLSS